MPKKTVEVSRKLRTVASPEKLAGSLAPEPPGTFDAPALPSHHNQQVSDATLMQAAKEWAAGVPVMEVEAKYGLSRSYIRQAMTRRFGSTEAMLVALEGLVLENAVGAQMIVQEKMHEMNAKEAVFAGKLLVETMGNLRSQRENMPKTIEFGQFKALGAALKEIREIVGTPIKMGQELSPDQQAKK